MNYWKMQAAEEINPAISLLPTAQKLAIISARMTKEDYEAEKDPQPIELVPDYNIVMVTDRLGNRSYVQCCTPRYNLIQHEEAFRPIIDALTVAGQDFRFTLTHTPERAWLSLFLKEAGWDGVSLGIEIANSFDGHHTLQYGLSLDKMKRTIEIVGYRQVCANGSKIVVPLDQAEIIRPEVRTRIEEIAKIQLSFKHTDNAMKKIEIVSYITEAMSLLREPVENMIKAGQNFKIQDKAKLAELIKLHVGRRFESKVLNAYANEEQDGWGLYNAITYVASHAEDVTPSARRIMLDKASDLLLDVVRSRR